MQLQLENTQYSVADLAREIEAFPSMRTKMEARLFWFIAIATIEGTKLIVREIKMKNKECFHFEGKLYVDKNLTAQQIVFLA